MKPYLIIINGLPATGKTTFATKLAQELSLPIFHKDDIKEAGAQNLENITADDAMKFSNISREIINYIVGQLKNDQSYIIDSNFSPNIQTEKFIETVGGFNIIEIFFKADGDILFDRFVQRVSERHPVHLEHHTGIEAYKEVITNGLLHPLNLGELIEVDTTDFSTVNFEDVVGQVRNLIK